MLDGRARHVLKKLAVIRHLTADGLSQRRIASSLFTGQRSVASG
jgi:hypothetical protein